MEAQVGGLLRGREVDGHTPRVGRPNSKPPGKVGGPAGRGVGSQRIELEGDGRILPLRSLDRLDEAEEMGALCDAAVDFPQDFDMAVRMRDTQEARFGFPLYLPANGVDMGEEEQCAVR